MKQSAEQAVEIYF